MRRASLARARGCGLPRPSRATANPGGRSENWLTRRTTSIARRGYNPRVGQPIGADSDAPGARWSNRASVRRSNARPLPPRDPPYASSSSDATFLRNLLLVPRALPPLARPTPPAPTTRSSSSPPPPSSSSSSSFAKDTRPVAVAADASTAPERLRFAAAAVADGRNTMGFRARLSPSARSFAGSVEGDADAATIAEGGTSRVFSSDFSFSPRTPRAFARDPFPLRPPPMISGSSRV